MVAFFPLFFIIGTTPSSEPNKILSTKLEIGFQSMGAIYTSDALIRVVSSAEHQAIADCGHEKFSTLRYALPDTITLLQFRNRSLSPFNSIQDLRRFLNTSGNTKTPYLRITMVLESSTTEDQTNLIEVITPLKDLDPEQISRFYAELNSSETISNDIDIGLRIPLAMFIPIFGEADTLDDIYLSFSLLIDKSEGDGTFFVLHPGSGFNKVRFLNPDLNLHNYKMVVWNQQVPKNGVASIDQVSQSGSIIGIYILVILLAGTIVKNISHSSVENLWISRMKDPKKLYNMCVAIDAFRTAREIEKEKDMTEQLLETFRSKETVIKLSQE